MAQDGSSRSSSSHSESRRVVVVNGEVILDEHLVDGVRQPAGGRGRGVPPAPAPGVDGAGGIPDLDRMLEDMMRRMRSGHRFPDLPPMPGRALPDGVSSHADAHAEADSRSLEGAGTARTPGSGGGRVAPPEDATRPTPRSHPQSPVHAPVERPGEPAPRRPGVAHPGSRDVTPPPPVAPRRPGAARTPTRPVEARGSGLRPRNPRGNDAPSPVFVELPPDRPAPPPAPSTRRIRRQI